MKKKFLYICFAFFVSVGLLVGINKTFSFANATTSQNTYLITSTNNGFNVSSDDGNIDGFYSLWSDAIKDIEDNSSAKSQTDIYIDFDNVDLDNTNDYYLLFSNSSFNYILSGEINSSSNHNVVKVSEETAITITFENITLNCANSDYVFLFNEGISHKMYVGGYVDYETKTTSFTKYVKSCAYGVTDIALTSEIQFVLPYDLPFNHTIMDYNNKYDRKNIKAVAEYDYYFVKLDYDSSWKKFFATSYIYIDFDVNGGEFVSHEFDNINYMGTVDFAIDGQISKFESRLCGWFGKVIYDDIDYYFDAKMLEDFSLVDYDFSQISNFFATDLNDEKLDEEMSFSHYSYYESDFKTKYHFDFFIHNKMRLSYIAKWEFYQYDLNFVTNSSESTIESKLYKFGDTIVYPENPTLTGYTFSGWYSDINLIDAFLDTTMPSHNVTLYAKWTVNEITITFNSNNGSTVQPIIANYGTEIEQPREPIKEGYKFKCWCTDEELTKEFIFDTMPANNMILYAKWEAIRYDVYLAVGMGYFEGNTSTLNVVVYGDVFARPSEDPVRVGYTFVDWYTSDKYTTLYNFNSQIKSIVTIYAKWQPIDYTISFDMGELDGIESITKIYDTDISLLTPSTPVNKGFLFLGWETDDGKTFHFNKMPAQNIVLKPKWQEKKVINERFTAQEYDYSYNVPNYKINSDIEGFYVYYFVDGQWVGAVPVKVGNFDIKIVRNEDQEYKSFEQIVENGFSVLRIQKDMTWLLVIFYILIFVEIAMVIFVRKMKKMKLSTTYSVALGEIYFISTGQMAHLVIVGGIALIGFVYFIYELVKLVRMANNENFAPSKLDNRERFKDDLVFQRNVLLDPNFTYETKTKESFGDKYSEEDIKNMLQFDDYSEKLVKTREDKIQNKVDNKSVTDNGIIINSPLDNKNTDELNKINYNDDIYIETDIIEQQNKVENVEISEGFKVSDVIDDELDTDEDDLL